VAVKFQCVVFWVVTSCSFVAGYQRCGRMSCLHLFVTTCKITRCQNPLDSGLVFFWGGGNCTLSKLAVVPTFQRPLLFPSSRRLHSKDIRNVGNTPHFHTAPSPKNRISSGTEVRESLKSSKICQFVRREISVLLPEILMSQTGSVSYQSSV
jgi:hypothetical protein